MALGRLRQENGFEFEVSLGFIESSRIALVAKHDPASENQKKDDMTLKTNVESLVHTTGRRGMKGGL